MLIRQKHFSLVLITTFLLILSGMGLMARPLYHFLRRAADSLQTEYIWRLNKNREFCAVSGNCVGRLTCPRIDLDCLVIYGATSDNLWRYPCWSENGALPSGIVSNELSRKGAIIIQGHRDAHFRKLGDMREGDRVSLDIVGKGSTSYQTVGSFILPKEELSQFLDSKSHCKGIFLVTCFPFHYLGEAPDRFILQLAPG